MATYRIVIRNLPAGQRDLDVIKAHLEDADGCGGPLASDGFGTIIDATFDGDTATCTVEGATAEVAERLDGKVYEGLYA